MAAFTSAGTTRLWDDTDAWNEAGFPDGADDTATIDSGTITLDGPQVCGGVILDTGGTFKPGFNGSLDVSAGEFSYQGGSLLFVDDIKLTGNFDLAGGTIDTNSKDLIVTDGTISYSSGVVTELNLVTNGTGDITWNTTSNPITFLTVSTGTLSKTGPTVVKKLLVQSGATLTSTNPLRIRQATSNDYIDIQGTFEGTGDLDIQGQADVSNSGRIVLGDDVTLTIGAFASPTTLTFTGEIKSADTIIRGLAGTNSCVAQINSPFVDLGDVLLGQAGVDRAGILNLTATAKIASLAQTATATSTEGLNLNSAFVELTGIVDGTGVTVTADDEAVHIVGIGGSADITNVDITGGNAVHTHECLDNDAAVGANGAEITFNTERYPYQSMTGVG